MEAAAEKPPPDLDRTVRFEDQVDPRDRTTAYTTWPPYTHRPYITHRIISGTGWPVIEHKYRPTFPRTFEEQEKRMDKHVEWKRRQIARRRWIHLWVGLGIAAGLLVGVPIATALVSAAWQIGLRSVLGQ